MIQLSLCCWLFVSLSTQNPEPTDIARVFLRLQQQLEPTSATDPHPPHKQQVELLEAFVARFAHSKSLASSPELLKARNRLAGLYLSRFELLQAKREFTEILRRSGIRDRDLRPRALYGLAQVQELEGRLATATGTLRRIYRSYEGTRYATYARIALLRIHSEVSAEIGRPAPAIDPHLDLNGRARDLASLLGEPVLLLFWSPDHPSGLDQTTDLLTAAADAGLAKGQVLSFGMHRDARLLKTTIEKLGWGIAVVPLSQEFLDPLVIKYGLRSIPSSFLIGPDATLLARDLSPARLTTALRALR